MYFSFSPRIIEEEIFAFIKLAVLGSNIHSRRETLMQMLSPIAIAILYMLVIVKRRGT
jgi:hypothetical protein